MAFTVAVVSVPLRSPPAPGSWLEATVPDICDIKPGCHVEKLEFHITAWPLTGAGFATARFWRPVPVAAVNVPLTSPPAAGSWLGPAVPDIWLKVYSPAWDITAPLLPNMFFTGPLAPLTDAVPTPFTTH